MYLPNFKFKDVWLRLYIDSLQSVRIRKDFIKIYLKKTVSLHAIHATESVCDIVYRWKIYLISVIIDKVTGMFFFTIQTDKIRSTDLGTKMVSAFFSVLFLNK